MKISKDDLRKMVGYRYTTTEAVGETILKAREALHILTHVDGTKQRVAKNPGYRAMLGKDIRNLGNLFDALNVNVFNVLKDDDDEIDNILDIIEHMPGVLYTDELTNRDAALLSLVRNTYLKPLQVADTIHTIIRMSNIENGGLEYPDIGFQHRFSINNLDASRIKPLKDLIKDYKKASLSKHHIRLRPYRDLLGEYASEYVDLRVLLDKLYRDAGLTSAKYIEKKKTIYESVIDVYIRDIKTNHYRGKKKYG